MSGATGKKGTAVRARGFALLRQVYAELFAQLGDIYSPSELLIAAQTLIDVSSDEYITQTYQDALSYPGYYSFAVDTMISQRPWLLLSNELRCDNLGDDRFAADENLKSRLSRLHNPDRYFHRG